MTGNEHPFYEYFDEILKICEEYDMKEKEMLAAIGGKENIEFKDIYKFHDFPPLGSPHNPVGFGRHQGLM